MKLLTKKIIQALPKFYSTNDISLNDKLVICKFFTPDANWTWFVFEGEPVRDETGNVQDDFDFYGMVHGLVQETGYFRVSELKKIRGQLGLSIERDLSVFKEPYAELIRQL